MLKLSRHLFCWTGDSSIADYYERALYNHILGQQDPETGMVTYFLPLLRVHINCIVPKRTLSGVVSAVDSKIMLNMEKLSTTTTTREST